MVYSKRDSKGQETNGNHDVRDKAAKNKIATRNQPNSKYYLKHGYNEDLNALHETDYMKYQNSINGRKPRNDTP